MANSEWLRRFHEAVKIPALLFEGDKLICDCGADAFMVSLVRAVISGVEDSGQPLWYTNTGASLYLGMVRLAGSPEYLAVGPCMAFECTRREARLILAGLGQDENRVEELYRRFKTIPVCGIERFRDVLRFLDYALNGAAATRAVVYAPRRKTTAKTDALPHEEADISFMEHFDERAEKVILPAVEFGKPEAIKTLFDEMDRIDELKGDIPPVDRNADRAFKNIFIYSLGSISQAARKGGLDADTAHALGTHYLERIETIEGSASISSLLFQMFLDFSQRVARCRRLPAGSPLAWKINRLINAELYDKITPTIISGLMGMNCSYLCRQFKKETGKTISAYINEVKIMEGKRLLASTEEPVIEIAARLGYSSQNYFQSIFKKIAGITPGEYRESRKTPDYRGDGEP